MAQRSKTTSEKGKFKEEINTALYKSKDIRELLLDDTSGMSNSKIRDEFKNHVKSHLFIDDTITDATSFIFYDVIFPSLKPNIKTCKVLVYAICHRDILDNYYKDGYYGNRADILSQMIENILINDTEVANSFGIGELTLDSVDIYNSSRFYGNVMTFSVPSFR
jgi:hypothetical protein